MKKLKFSALIITIFSALLLFSVVIVAVGTANASASAQSSVPSEYSSMSAEQIAGLKKYDPRDELTPVKDQGDTNLCWAYTAINATEASVLKDKLASKDALRLNPLALAYRNYVRNSDPLGNNSTYYSSYAADWLTRAGNISQTSALFSMWQGPIGGDKYNADVWDNSLYRLESANNIHSDFTGEERIAELKRAIAEYGAVTASCYYDGGTKPYYNDYAVTNGVSHAVTLIGWDDEIDKDLFKPGQVGRNGGWLVKNSYSDNGYFWLTYESKISATTSWTFTYAPREAYDFNYYYDNNADTAGYMKPTQCANVYEAKKGTADTSEYIEAVNIGFTGNDVTVKIKVYTSLPSWGQNSVENGVLAAEKTQSFKYGGYNTIKLDSPVKIAAGSYFSIVAEVLNPQNNRYLSVVQSDSKKPSFRNSSYGYDYISNGNFVARIKAYTKLKPNDTSSGGEEVHVHEWNEPTYTWSDDNTLVTAKRVCKKDESHVETETASASSAITQPPQCTRKGNERFTSDAFQNSAFSVQTKDVQLDFAPHTPNMTSPTETEPVKCTVCDRILIEATGHIKHDTVFVPAQDATCETNGTKAHYICKGCSDRFEDAEATKKITDENLLVVPKAHKYGEWIDEIPATEQSPGVKGHKDCIYCNKSFGADNNELTDLTIPALPKTATVTITNGSGNSQNVTIGSTVTVVADAPEKGKKFSGWVDADGNLVSSDPTYTFTVTQTTSLTATYAEIETAPQAKPLSVGAIVGIASACVISTALLIFIFVRLAVKKKSLRKR